MEGQKSAVAYPIHVRNSHAKFGWISPNGLGGVSVTSGRTDGGDCNIPIPFLKSVEKNVTYLYLSGLDNIVVSPAKHRRHIGIINQLASSSSAASHFRFLINTCNCEGIHPFYSVYSRESIIKCRSSSNSKTIC